MDIFLEYIVKHKQTSKDLLIKVGISLLACILAFVVMIFAKYLFGMWLLLIVGIFYGAYQLMKSRNLEFEYIMTNSSLDIDKIIARSRRKRVVSLDFKEIEICAAIDDPMHKAEFEAKEGITKTIYCTGDGTTDIYFIDFAGKDGRTRVLFQPPVKIVEEAHKFNPRKIFVKQA